MPSKLKLAPSVLSADFTRLAEEIRIVEKAGADWLHLDIMDGHFVPNITFGPFIVKQIKALSPLYLDCHLMIENPGQYLEDFAKAGADGITIHQETVIHLDAELNRIKALGCKAGVSINPATPLEVLKPILPLADLVLIMSVNPGFGGQKLIPYCLEKVRELKAMSETLNKDLIIQMDGGIKLDNLDSVLQAGANSIVAGSAIFGKDTEGACRAFRKRM